MSIYEVHTVFIKTPWWNPREEQPPRRERHRPGWTAGLSHPASPHAAAQHRRSAHPDRASSHRAVQPGCAGGREGASPCGAAIAVLCERRTVTNPPRPRIATGKARAERREAMYRRPHNSRRRSRASLPAPRLLSADVVRWHLPAARASTPPPRAPGEEGPAAVPGAPSPKAQLRSQPPAPAPGLAAFVSHP